MCCCVVCAVALLLRCCLPPTRYTAYGNQFQLVLILNRTLDQRKCSPSPHYPQVYDVEATYYIEAHQLLPLLRELPEPLGARIPLRDWMLGAGC